MGICYNIFMLTEGNIDCKGFEEAWTKHRYAPTLEGSGWGWAVYDLDKASPLYDPGKDIVNSYCDRAYYWTDHRGWELTELPRKPVPLNPPDHIQGPPEFSIDDLDKKLKEFESRNRS